MTRPQILGMLAATMVTVGLFLPALSFPHVSISLWDAHRWTAGALLASAGLALYWCGARAYRWLIPTAIAAMFVAAGQLLHVIWRINSQLTENVALSAREPGWAALFASGIPKVNWLGWGVVFSGIAVMLLAGMHNKSLNPTGNKPAG